MLTAIMTHSDFEMVWSALSEFVSRENHRLVICVGNHDLELAYPNVQEQIVMQLGGAANESIRGRILFSTMGVGHLCRVGNAEKSARVLCIHGNEYDEWNSLSPEAMARLVRSACLGRAARIAEDPPNAGTELVIDVMNKIKKDYPFVDLLKPEIDTVFNVLLALDPDTLEELPSILRLTAKAKTQGASRVSRVLGGPADETTPASAVSRGWQPGGQFGAFLGEASSASDLLKEAWELSESEVPALEEQPDDLLGMKELLVNTYRYVRNRIAHNPREALRHALLDWLGGDKTWDLDGPDGIYDALEKLDPDVGVVIAGHTHLRRQMEVPRPKPDAPIGTPRYLYLNTGTWARLMKLDETLLGSTKAFSALWSTLQEGTMEALDRDPRRIVRNMGTVGVVRWSGTGKAVEAALCEKKAGQDEPQLVEGARWQEVKTHG